DGFMNHNHALEAVLKDHRNLVRERWIVSNQIGHGKRQDMAVAVLVLQSFAGECRPPGCATAQEATSTHVGRGPDQVADTLKPEHRVVNEKRDRVDPESGVCSADGDKG